MSETALSARVTAEIEALHVEFERWMRGASNSLGRIEATLLEDFTFISPQGDVVDGGELRENLRGAHGTRQIRIRIENAVVRWSGPAGVVATYEEWHDHDDYTTARQATVLFTQDETAPGGLRWRHVHETWKIPPPHRR